MSDVKSETIARILDRIAENASDETFQFMFASTTASDDEIHVIAVSSHEFMVQLAEGITENITSDYKDKLITLLKELIENADE